LDIEVAAEKRAIVKQQSLIQKAYFFLNTTSSRWPPPLRTWQHVPTPAVLEKSRL